MTDFVFRVGGVVSESSYKFFLQFIFYTALFTCFTLIVSAIFISELHSDVSLFDFLLSSSFNNVWIQTGSVNPHWAVALGL
jgi:palmitoyltransferase